MKTCTTCYWKTACHLRSSGNALRCGEWNSERRVLADILMVLFGAVALASSITVGLLILAAKGF